MQHVIFKANEMKINHHESEQIDLFVIHKVKVKVKERKLMKRCNVTNFWAM
ncbi:hypothetical protein Hanom_Chr10g00933051 [Helianthus anomalus]